MKSWSSNVSLERRKKWWDFVLRLAHSSHDPSLVPSSIFSLRLGRQIRRHRNPLSAAGAAAPIDGRWLRRAHAFRAVPDSDLSVGGGIVTKSITPLYQVDGSIYGCRPPKVREPKKYIMYKFFGFTLALIALSACADRTPPIQSSERLTLLEGATALPAPERGDLTAPPRAALIGPLDTIEVDVFSVPELSREIQVDASGGIAMPLIGMIDAGGKTAGELAREIEHALRGRYVREPQVTVNIRSSVSQVVTVDGQVVEPGLYPVTNQMTLLRTVASAKGLTEFAREDDVVILRTVEGRKLAGLYNISAIRRGVYDDPPVYANDVVIVGDSPQRRLFRDLVQLSPLLAAPLLAVLQ